MSNRKLIAILLIVAAVFTMASGTILIFSSINSVDDLVLNNMQIVLPTNATEIEKTAADELNTYIGKITGTELSIVAEGQSEITAGIYIGNTQFASANGVTYPEAEFNEGWAIKAVNGNLVLCGGESRGVLYSVYHLLEDGLGVHWWNYWEEYVPTMTEARIAGDYNASGKPTFVWRDIHGGKTSVGEENVACVRNRLNGETANAPAAYGGEEGYGLPAYVHTFNRYFTEEDFGSNPEWFALVGGKRISTGQLCLTNQELVEEMTNRVLQSIETSYANADAMGIKRPLYYNISPNDFADHCTCTDCLQSRTAKGESGYLLTFVNQVAAKVGQVHPEVFIDTLAYAGYIDVPLDDTKPADNVLVRLCISGRDCIHGLSHQNNAESLKQVEEWVALTKEGQLYIWDYCVFYGNSGVVPTVLDYAENFQLLYERGADGYFAEQENPIMSDFWDMKFWMNAKLMEDPYQDENALIDTFLNGYYGAGAPYIRQYLELTSAAVGKTSIHQIFGEETDKPLWLTASDVVTANNLFEQAMAAAAGDETALKHIRHARNALDRVIVNNHSMYETLAKADGVAFNLDRKVVCQRVIDVLKEQIQWRGNYDYDAETYLAYYEELLTAM